MADIIETIGAGGTHATIAAWDAAHKAKDMVALGNRYIGELIDQVYEVDAGVLSFANTGTRSSTAYRWLRSAASAGGYYRPERHTGPRIYVRYTGTGDQAGIRVEATESFMRMSGFALICEDPQEVGGGNKYGFHIQGDNFIGHRLFCRISEGGQRASASAPIFYCYYINNVSGNNADGANFLNCIAYGSRSWRGAHYGFFFDNFAANGGVFNCAAYSIRHSSGITGGFGALTNVAVKPKCVNSVAVDCSTSFFGLWAAIAIDPSNGADPLSVAEPYQCIASDYSLPLDVSVPRASANRNGVDSRSVHGRPDVQDLRPMPGSVVHKNGRDLSTLWTSFGLPIEDFDGVVRPGGSGGYLSLGWTIGPYHTAFSPLALTAPTVEVKSIGSAGGRDYATIQAFLDATDDQSLVYTNKVVIGELYADSNFSITAGSRVVARRTIADERHYREIRPAAGQAFDPVNSSGVKILGDGGATAGEANLVEAHEEHFRLTGPILVDVTYTGSSNRRGVKIQGDRSIATSIFSRLLASTGTASHVFLVRSSRALVANCIAIGSNSTGTGANSGFNVQNCEFARIYCCVAWGIKGNGGGNGFREGANTNRVEFSSSIATDCTTCFSHATGTNAPRVQSFCISGDSTADGAGAQRTVSASVLFKAPASGDFRNLSGSPALKRGGNLTVRFSADFAGERRYAPFDCGAFEGLPPGPLFRAPTFQESRAWVGLWELQRKDGVALLFTDQNEPVVYRGRSYSPGGAWTASARRGETQQRSMSARVALSSGQITAEDLSAGRYRGARLREILLGRQLFTVPIEESLYVLGEVDFDADRAECDFASLSSLLSRNAGRLVTVGCPLRLGSEECTVDLTPNTLDDVRVGSTIQDPRRKFNANSADVSGSYPDGYFTKGEFVVLSGLNAGLVGQVKSYVASTRTFELEEALPYNVATNDTFLFYPGCRKRYVLDCITTHQNGINYGGDPFMPGTAKSMSTPTR